jgi:hypothetical protein
VKKQKFDREDVRLLLRLMRKITSANPGNGSGFGWATYERGAESGFSG